MSANETHIISHFINSSDVAPRRSRRWLPSCKLQGLIDDSKDVSTIYEMGSELFCSYVCGSFIFILLFLASPIVIPSLSKAASTADDANVQQITIQSVNNQSVFDQCASSIAYTPLTLFTSTLLNPKVLSFTMTGDFAKVKKISAGGNWTGEDRPINNYGVPVKIEPPKSINEKVSIGNIDSTIFYMAMMQVRGMSSADVAEFPKLKVKLTDEDSKRSGVFQGVKSFRINTSGFHNNPFAPFREALAYEMAQILDLPTPKFQRALIEYRQLSEDTIDEKSYQVLSDKQALIIENDHSMLKRLGATDVSGDFWENKIQVDHSAASLFFMFNALIFNADIGLSVRNEPTIGTEKYRPLFNTTILKFESQTQGRPLVYDLDKAEMVGIGNYNEIKPSLILGRMVNGYEESLFTVLSRLRQRFNDDEISSAIKLILSKMGELKTLVSERESMMLVDSAGAQQARLQLELFEKLAPEFRKYKITLVETPIYSEPKTSTENSLLPLDFSDNIIPLRPGTPIKILAKTQDGKFLKVVILDTRYEIKNNIPDALVSGHNEYIGFIDAKTPIGKSLSEKKLGYINDIDMNYFF